jgi:hypothetical protein
MRNIIAVAFTALIVASASAFGSTIAYFSFEEPDLADGTRIDIPGAGNTTTIPGWTTQTSLFGTATASFGTWNPQDSSFFDSTGPDPAGSLFVPATFNNPQGSYGDGLQAVQIHLQTSTGPGSSASLVSNSLGLVEPNTKYTLTLGIGRPLDGEVEEFLVELHADGFFMASRRDRGASLAKGRFSPFTLDYTTGPADSKIGRSLRVTLSQSNGIQAGNFRVAFDNIKVTATSLVPEPSTFVLLSGALACYGSGRRRSRHVA